MGVLLGGYVNGKPSHARFADHGAATDLILREMRTLGKALSARGHDRPCFGFAVSVYGKRARGVGARAPLSTWQ